MILGEAIEAVSKAAESLDGLGKYGILANIAIQLAVSGSIAQMWSMVNALQIVQTFNYFSTDVPGNVLMVMTNLFNMIQVNLFPTDLILNALFNFSETESPGMGFERAGNDTKVLIPYLGTTFFFAVLILAAYILYGFVHWCGKYSKLFKKIAVWCY